MTTRITIVHSGGTPAIMASTKRGWKLSVDAAEHGLTDHVQAIIDTIEALDDSEGTRAEARLAETQAIITQTIPFVEQSASDDELLELIDVFPNWEDLIGERMYVGRVFRHEGLLYKSRQDHTAQEDWIPGQGTLAIYERIQLPPEEGEILPWVPGESVAVGDLREFEVIVYEVIQTHTTQAGWEPPSAPALWKVHDH